MLERQTEARYPRPPDPRAAAPASTAPADAGAAARQRTFREALTARDWLRAIALIRPNAARQARDASPAQQILFLGQILGARGHVQKALELLSPLCTNKDPGVAVESIACRVLLEMNGQDCDVTEARGLTARAQALAGESARLRGIATHAHARVRWREGALDEAGALLREAHKHLEGSPEEPHRAWVLDSLASWHEERGALNRALSFHSLALAFHARQGNHDGMAATLYRMGMLHLRLKDPELALSCLREAHDLAARIRNRLTQSAAAEAIRKARASSEAPPHLAAAPGTAPAAPPAQPPQQTASAAHQAARSESAGPHPLQLQFATDTTTAFLLGQSGGGGVHAPESLASSPLRIGPYEVNGHLGSGAFAHVYKAIDPTGRGPDAEVAIKCLSSADLKPGGGAEQHLARFQRECAALAQVSHPNVVKLIEAGTEPMPYLVMEHLAGGDLKARLTPGKGCDPVFSLKIARGILSGLDALHAADIVHRDMKPANVILRANGEPVVADLGMARLLDLPVITVYATLLGTIGYMAPEQLRGRTVDHRADLYSAGCILFQMLAGRLPFEGTSAAEIMRRICNDPPPRLETLAPGLPRRVYHCVARSLRKNPARRWQSAREMRAALENVAVAENG